MRPLMSLVLSVLCLLVLPLSAQELGPPPEIPPGIRYTPATQEQDKASISLFKAILAGEDQISPIAIVGPRLAARLGSIEEGEVVPVTFHIPEVERALRSAGYGCRGQESNQQLASKIQGVLGQEYSLRRPTEVELRYYWALAPFDLEGSLFICATPEASLLCHHLGEKMFLFEDLSELGASYEAAFEGLSKLPGSELEPDPQGDYVAAVLSGGEVPEPLQDATELTTSTVVLLTPEDLVNKRVEATALADYLKPILDAMKAQVKAEQLQRVFVQLDLQADGPPLLRLGSQPEMTSEAREQLRQQLEGAKAPVVRGPICLFMVECPD